MRTWVGIVAKAIRQQLTKRWRLAIWAAITLILAVQVLAHSAVYRACTDEQRQTSNQNEPKSAPPVHVFSGEWAEARFGCIGSYVDANHESIIAAFTVLLAIVTGWLWLATERLVKGADANAARQLRAYISVSADRPPPAEQGSVDAIAASINVVLFIANDGQTPAYNVRHWMNIKSSNFPEPGDLPPVTHARDRPVGVLNPGRAIGVTGTTNWGPGVSLVSGEDAIGTAIYVYGRVAYVDAFGEDRWTVYRFAVPEKIGRTTSLWICDDGNDAN